MGIIEADADRAFCREGLGHLTADVDADGGVAAGAGVVEVTTEPAVALEFLRIAGGLPNLGGAEVRAVRIGIANALNYGEMCGIEKVFEPSQPWMKADRVIEFQDLIGREADFGPTLAIVVIGKRHDGVQAVIATGHLENDENSAVLAGSDLGRFISRLGLQGRKSMREKRGNGPGERTGEDRIAQELATRVE